MEVKEKLEEKGKEDNLLKYKKLQKEIYQKERLLIAYPLISFVTLFSVFWLDKYFELGNWLSYGVTFVLVLPYFLYVMYINIIVAIKRYNYRTTGKI
ncbi:hypothetical protein NQ113_24560 [Bacillus pseudomycoides]|uniref:hypothetical protein n=1 Tax=Bacillus pseudomycoides TaxID=64104 RepID=UPI00215A880B|nr:hypothetical protein [Bacillus pseudomycoides]MCR8860346.1 hypothetical protein [Bacillus pseudomycoides]